MWATIPNTYAAYFGLVPFITALMGCFFILLLADEVRIRRLNLGLFSSPSLILLGQMSLSLFLLHPLVNTVINLSYAKASGELMPWWMLALAGPPLSIMVAYAYFRVVEVPIRHYRTRASRKARPSHVASGDPIPVPPPGLRNAEQGA